MRIIHDLTLHSLAFGPQKFLEVLERRRQLRGKLADFIVLDANPLDDIANSRRINQVFLRGREVDRAGLRARWQKEWGNQ